MSEKDNLKDEGRWGGKRPNQSGRPKMPAALKKNSTYHNDCTRDKALVIKSTRGSWQNHRHDGYQG